MHLNSAEQDAEEDYSPCNMHLNSADQDVVANDNSEGDKNNSDHDDNYANHDNNVYSNERESEYEETIEDFSDSNSEDDDSDNENYPYDFPINEIEESMEIDADGSEIFNPLFANNELYKIIHSPETLNIISTPIVISKGELLMIYLKFAIVNNLSHTAVALLHI
ncbi:uncharacterized protein DDB_G0290685-like [Leptopilina boulardi]|uniref:uncharacterized protein DDB_G0290685-like n=1 Tax=Leptopilina boulardi TaxID=63433 RepID=UPI0021F510DF|nr:uncharacterized protein DDB_G0290685-like [Leptopilina boulardi]